jgi:integrase
METGDLAALQAILGHRTVAMTMRYSHLVTDHLHRAIAKLGTSLGTNTAESDEDRVGRLHLNR